MSRIINNYDHSRKVANPGDLIKGTTIAELIDLLLGRKSPEPFTYLESHSGRARYVLPDIGEWRSGIGAFLSILKAEFGVGWREHITDNYPHLRPFVHVNLAQDIGPGSEYFGSSRLVLGLLKQAGKDFRFHLWDTNEDVCNDLRASYADYPEISVYNGDGYEGLMQCGQASFALVDPISVAHEKDKILDVLSSLSRRSIPFLCWTALVDSPEERFNVELESAARSLYSLIQTAWREPDDHTWGCRLIVPKEIAAEAKAAAQNVASLMNWRLT